MNNSDMNKVDIVTNIIDNIETKINLEKNSKYKDLTKDLFFIILTYGLMNYLSLPLIGLNVYSLLTLGHNLKQMNEVSRKEKYLKKLDKDYFYKGKDITNELINFDNVISSKESKTNIVKSMLGLGLLATVVSSIDQDLLLNITNSLNLDLVKESSYAISNVIGATFLHMVNKNFRNSKEKKDIVLNNECVIKDEILNSNDNTNQASYNVELENLTNYKKDLEQKLQILTYDRALEEIKKEREEKVVSKQKYLGK